MESKTKTPLSQKFSRMKGKSAVEVVKSKVKNKERQQLWDSMLEVYQKEVNKENISDCEEVDINDIENWSMSHPGDALRALPHLVETNPELVYKVLPGSIDDSPELIKEDNNKTTKKKVTAANKNSTKDSKLVSYVNIKTQKVKSTQPAKKSVKRKSNSTTEISLVKKKKTAKCSANPSKTTVQTKKSKSVRNVTKTSTQKSSGKTLDHKCKLRLSKYAKTKRVSNREDGRIFTWDLVFKVCECTESDVVL